MEEPAGNNEHVESSAMRTLKHDIKNQLSNIHLALEQLRFELPDASEDCIFYMDLISKSSTKIDTLLKDAK